MLFSDLACNLQVWLLWIWPVFREGESAIMITFILYLWLWLFVLRKCTLWWSKYIYLYLCFLWQPSEQNTYADIEAAYKCLEEKYGAKEENIVLYGQSVGSGPTLDLAVRLPRLRAVVLHSPIMSGLRVMYPVKHSYWFDIYKVLLCSTNLFCYFGCFFSFCFFNYFCITWCPSSWFIR